MLRKCELVRGLALTPLEVVERIGEVCVHPQADMAAMVAHTKVAFITVSSQGFCTPIKEMERSRTSLIDGSDCVVFITESPAMK